MSHSHHRHQRIKVRSVHLWHRYTGLSVALLALILAISGLLLNHTEAFQWDRRYVNSSWLLDWYGIEAPQQVPHFPLGKQSITLFGNRLYLNTTALEGEFQQLHGALASDDLLAVVVDQSLLLLTKKGELIEQLDSADGLPVPISAMGMTRQGMTVVQVESTIYQADHDWLHWTRWEGNQHAITWAQSQPLPEALQATLSKRFRSHIVPMERVLLDLHSGRLFGRYGTWIMDLAALMMVFLAGSGVWMWSRRRR